MITTGIAGVAITAGQAVYLSSGTYLLAKGDTAPHAAAAGIALDNAAINQPVTVQYGGPINIGATTVVGQTYVVSAANAGGIAPVSDLTTGNFVSTLGIATSASAIQVSINNSGTAHA